MATAVLTHFGASDRAQLAAEAGRLIERLRRHGAGPDGGVTRLVYSPEWRGAEGPGGGWVPPGGVSVRGGAPGGAVRRLSWGPRSGVPSGAPTHPVGGRGGLRGGRGGVCGG